MDLKRVVVTGIGTINPIGNNISEYFDNLQKGVSGANMITHFDTTLFKTKFACEVKNFDISNHGDAFEKKEAKRLDLYSQFALIAAHEALMDSKVDLSIEDLDEIGVVWASGIGGMNSFYQEVLNFVEGGKNPRYNPFFVPKMISDIAAGQISMKYGLRGPNYSTVSACASSTHAMIDAFTLIRMGKANIILTGGSEATIYEPGIGGFNAMHALSTNNESYLTASRPFDKTRDGFVMGEGAGGLILEEHEHAIKRGAKIYAEVVGGGMTADAYHLTAPHPEGLGAKAVMIKTLKEAEITPDKVDYVNVHGTSTPLGDIAELLAVKGVFGEHAYKLNISSTKSMTGHLLGATGAVEVIACIFALERQMIPPTINFEHEDPEIDYKLNLTLNQVQERKVEYTISNTFGFGGHNSSVLLKKYK